MSEAGREMNHPVRYTFNRAERLRSAELIQKIFNREGEKLSAFPLSLFYLETDLSFRSVPAQVMFVVPKKNLRRQADRAHTRRLLRELYRLNKQNIYQSIGDRQFVLVWHYAAKETTTFHQLEPIFLKLAHGFAQRIQ